MPEIRLESIITIFTLVATVAASFAVSRYQSHAAHSRARRLEEWRDAHEREASDHRVSYEQRFGEMRALAAAQEARDQEILRRLDQIDRKVDRRENKGGGR